MKIKIIISFIFAILRISEILREKFSNKEIGGII